MVLGCSPVCHDGWALGVPGVGMSVELRGPRACSISFPASRKAGIKKNTKIHSARAIPGPASGFPCS